MTKRVDPVSINRISGTKNSRENDLVVVEEPLEIRIGYGSEEDRQQTTVTVTMRTPGDDEHLCLGFISTEGMIDSVKEVMSAKYCNNIGDEDGGENVMRVELSPAVSFNPDEFQRNFYTNSSCGVCGKASIDHIRKISQPLVDTGLKVSVNIVRNLLPALEDAQNVFKHTGGLHACALFTVNGELILHKEDVGRHNALDKLVGSLLLEDKLPASNNVLMLSGRISFELVQKAVKAGIPIIAAVGAPSSLSIELAKEYGVTLIGFLKKEGFNIYTSPERIIDHYETKN
jgi:FdhD protein